MIEPAPIIAIARTCLGAPYRHQGRDPRTGLDCAGLIAYLAHTLGLPVIDRHDYPRTAVDNTLERAFDAQPCLQRNDPPASAPGRVLILRRALRPQHVLLCVTNEIVLHADDGAGRVIEHVMPNRWRHRLVASYTFVEAT